MTVPIFTVWLTGLSGSGKTTIAKALCEKLRSGGFLVHHLDGDEVRAASKEKLGFSKEDRDKNIALAIDLALQHQKMGKAVIASFISPYKKHREVAKTTLPNFIEVFVDAPLEICEQRDPKGLYKKARSGEIVVFTGISDPYEPPKNPQLHLETHKISIDDCVNEIVSYLKKTNLI